MNKINILLLSFLLVGCNQNKIKGTWENIVAQSVKTSIGGNANPFNTAMSLKYFIEEKIENKEVVLQEVKDIYQNNIKELHKKFDRHNSYYIDDLDKDKGFYQNIKTINALSNRDKFIELDYETYNLLKLGVEYTKYTEGYFNIFTGSISDFWDELFNEAYLGDISFDPYFNKEKKDLLNKLVEEIPSTKEINDILIFDEEKKAVKFTSLKKNISISVGGIAKGVATDIVKRKLIEKGYNSGYLFSGSSSISSLSKPIFDNGVGQYISVLDPRTASSIFDKKAAFGINLKEEFNMSTSGNYISGKSYRFKDNNGEYITRHHIIDSFTGYPVYQENIASVSIFSKTLDAGILDAFSTAIVNMGVEKGLKFRERVINDFNCDLEIIFIQENIKDETIKIISTSNFNKTLKVSDSKGINIEYV